jgi:hypothetical protein
VHGKSRAKLPLTAEPLLSTTKSRGMWKTLLEMMQAGYLVDLRALQVLLQADFDALRTQQGDFVEAELETLLLAANAPAQVLAAFQAHAADRKALPPARRAAAGAPRPTACPTLTVMAMAKPRGTMKVMAATLMAI